MRRPLRRAAVALLASGGLAILTAAAAASLGPQTAVAATPAVTTLTSTTHPSEGHWYAKDAARLTWGTVGSTVGLTDGSMGSAVPVVSNDRVVWWEYTPSSLSEAIYTWTPADDVVKVAEGPDLSFVRVSGDRIVWAAGDNVAGWGVYTWTPTGGVVKVDETDYCGGVQVSGDRIVWEGWSATALRYAVFTWTPEGGVVRLTGDTARAWNPQVSGDRVVWEGGDGGSRFEIYTWTPAGGVRALTRNDIVDRYPQVSGSRVVWQSGEWGLAIRTWTPAAGVRKLARGLNPQVSGQRVVWAGHDEIYTWTPSSGIVRVTHNGLRDDGPQVAGSRIVWIRHPTSGYHPTRVYSWTPRGGVVRLAEDSSSSPQVSARRVVWGDQSDVYTWTPRPTSGWTYSYVLDGVADTVPDEVGEGTAVTRTYDGLADGVWYFHVRARDGLGVWGTPAHRAVCIDTQRPTTRAPQAASAARGQSATLQYEVVDPRPGSPTARVTIKVKNRAGTVVKTLGPYKGRPVNTLLAATLTVPRTWRPGAYEFFVYATDRAGNVQLGVGYNTLTVR